MGTNGTVPNLVAHHLAGLRQSGLSDETIASSRIYSEDDHYKLAAILNGSYAKRRGPALVIPFLDRDGAIVFRRLRPDNARVDSNGRKIKYESPRGLGNRAYFPPGVFPLLDDPATEIVFVEGEKKALAGFQHGFVTIGLVGVYGWKHGKATDRLIPDLEAIAWNGRQVRICFDSDLQHKPEVREAEARLAAQIVNRGGKVRCVRLPDGPEGEKQGLDDFLLTHSPAELRRLLDAAEDPDPVDVSASKTPANQLDAMPEARRFLDQVCTHEGVRKLRYWRGEFYGWDGLRYRAIPDDELAGRLTGFLDAYVSYIGQGTVRNILACIRAETLVGSHLDMPLWLDGTRSFPADEVLITKSGILHLPSLIRGEPSLLPVTPRLFSSVAVTYDFDPAAGCPTWLEFLESLWPQDQESIDTLQEFCGYLLTGDTSQHKFLMLVGPPRSGKGTIGRIIRGVIGEGNLAAPTLASLAGPFGLWPLLNKSAAIIADARLSGRTDAVAVVERLLSITGEDPQDVHRKSLPTLTGIRLSVRFVILTNELPNLRDASGALLSRVLLLRLTRSFLGKEDKSLTDKLLSELSGILNWSIVGWQRLQERGAFVQPGSGADLLDDLQELASPVGQFIRERCSVGPEFSCPLDELFDAWKDWCERHGRDHCGTRETFARDLRAALPQLTDSRPRLPGREQRQKVYNGITVLIGGTGWDRSQAGRLRSENGKTEVVSVSGTGWD